MTDQSQSSLGTVYTQSSESYTQSRQRLHVDWRKLHALRTKPGGKPELKILRIAYTPCGSKNTRIAGQENTRLAGQRGKFRLGKIK